MSLKENFNDIYELQLEMKTVLGISLQEMAQGPTADRPPAGMIDNAENKKAWSNMMKKYDKNIFKSNDIKKQWAAAVAIFKRSAKKRNLKIFSGFEMYSWDKFVQENLEELNIEDIVSDEVF